MSRLSLLPVLWSVVALYLLVGASANAEAPVPAPPKVAAYSPDLSKWLTSAMPISWKQGGQVANYSDYQWQVYRQGKQVQVRLVSWPDRNGRLVHRPQDASQFVSLPFRLNRVRFDQQEILQIAEPRTLPGPTRHPLNNDFQVTYPVSDGYLMAFNGGEWGAALWWFSADGTRSYSVCKPDDVIGFFDTRAGLLAPEGLAHLGLNRGQVLRLSRDATGQWKVEPFASLSSTPRAATLDYDGQLVIVTTEQLLRVDMDGKVTVLLDQVPWRYLVNATSIAIDDEGDIFLGAWHGVLRIHRHDNGVWKPQWLLPNHAFVTARADDLDVILGPSGKKSSRLRH